MSHHFQNVFVWPGYKITSSSVLNNSTHIAVSSSLASSSNLTYMWAWRSCRNSSGCPPPKALYSCQNAGSETLKPHSRPTHSLKIVIKFRYSWTVPNDHSQDLWSHIDSEQLYLLKIKITRTVFVLFNILQLSNALNPANTGIPCSSTISIHF